MTLINRGIESLQEVQITSESFPQLWLFGLGALFIGVVLLFPNGLAGIYRTTLEPRVRALLGARAPKDDPAEALQQPAE